MAKQFSILATDVDLTSLEQELRNAKDVELLSNEANDSLDGLRPLSGLAIPPSQAGKVSLICYLAPRDMPQRILIERVSDVKVRIDEQRSHLIQFWRPYFDGVVMRPGRLYYQNRLVRNNAFVSKDASFCKWADAVMARIRRFLRMNKTEGSYVGADAAKRILSGLVKIDSIL